MIETAGMIEISAGADENKLYYKDGKIYRYTPTVYNDPRWGHQLDFMASPFFDELQDRRLVPRHTLVDKTSEFHVYEVEVLHFITRPWEHTQHQNVQILKTVCDIQVVLKDFKLNLTDSHLYNFAFNGTKPMLLDVGSIDTNCEIVGPFKTNCQEYVPQAKPEIDIALESGDWKRCSEILSGVVSEQPYSERYPDMGWEELAALNTELVKCDFDTVVDLGGNCGFVSAQLFKNKRSIVVDCDKPMLVKGFKNAIKENLQHNFAYFNITNPCEPHCPSVNPYQSEDLHKFHIYAGWMSRLRSDMVFASSISHHLLRAGMNFEKIAKMCDKLATKYIFFEIIDHSDACTPGWYGPDVNIANFLKFLPDWKLVKTLPQKEHTRKWHILEHV